VVNKKYSDSAAAPPPAPIPSDLDAPGSPRATPQQPRPSHLANDFGSTPALADVPLHDDAYVAVRSLQVVTAPPTTVSSRVANGVKGVLSKILPFKRSAGAPDAVVTPTGTLLADRGGEALSGSEGDEFVTEA